MNTNVSSEDYQKKHHQITSENQPRDRQKPQHFQREVLREDLANETFYQSRNSGPRENLRAQDILTKIDDLEAEKNKLSVY